jgi:hypothetical protein
MGLNRTQSVADRTQRRVVPFSEPRLDLGQDGWGLRALWLKISTLVTADSTQRDGEEGVDACICHILYDSKV